jgi:hypothetical protein
VSPRKKQAAVECSFLIPIRGDEALSDGSVHSTVQWEWLNTELWSRFSGATQSPGLYVGFYQDPDSGQMVTDESRRFVVAVPPSRLKAMRDLMRAACDVFHQKCIYLSIAGRVEFIERSSP